MAESHKWMGHRTYTRGRAHSRHLPRPCRSQYSEQCLILRAYNDRNRGLRTRRFRLSSNIDPMRRCRSRPNSAPRHSRIRRRDLFNLSRQSQCNPRRRKQSSPHIPVQLSSPRRSQSSLHHLSQYHTRPRSRHRPSKHLRSLDLIQKSSSPNLHHTSSLRLRKLLMFHQRHYRLICLSCCSPQRTNMSLQHVA
jgi:hypothetical protein